MKNIDLMNQQDSKDCTTVYLKLQFLLVDVIRFSRITNTNQWWQIP